ncbi:MAG TPA: hypothetical protein VKU00_10395 [Chthonomonadaceae bacterium]|nr:hypothetical protein [Chthonomonadaceae bacterium]
MPKQLLTPTNELPGVQSPPSATSDEVVAGRYPTALLQEYHALTDKKFKSTLTVAEAERLQAIRNEIAELDKQRPRPDTWDRQAEQLRQELAQLRAEIEALPDADPT